MRTVTPTRLAARRLTAALALVPSLALGLAGCSVNPATGQRQLALIGEQQEVELGRQADQELVAELGLYPDEALQAYVSALGRELAAKSERPHLPWTFRVIDDPVVNAFALPGGFIYITRGILAHIGSEAELVSVLGHEIGHVTGRHGVEQMSKAQLAQIGLAVGSVVSPEVGRYGGLAQAGLGLLFLKYGRDDEREADSLGLRYLLAGGYEPNEMPKMFTTLRRVSEAAGAGRIPAWMSTHPDPDARGQRIRDAIAAAGGSPGGKVERESYVRRLDGLVFGADPREGFFEGDTFYHPGLAFSLRFPSGWKTSNQKRAVTALAPGEDAIVALGLADEASPDEAARAFFAQSGISRGNPFGRRGFAGLPAVTAGFGVAREQQENLAGVAAFVRHQERVFRLLGFTLEPRWQGYRQALETAVESFAPVRDRKILEVKPDRLDVVTLDRALNVEELARRYPGADAASLSLLNGCEPTATLPAGFVARRVVRGRQGD